MVVPAVVIVLLAISVPVNIALAGLSLANLSSLRVEGGVCVACCETALGSRSSEIYASLSRRVLRTATVRERHEGTVAKLFGQLDILEVFGKLFDMNSFVNGERVKTEGQV